MDLQRLYGPARLTSSVLDASAANRESGTRVRALVHVLPLPPLLDAATLILLPFPCCFSRNVEERLKAFVCL